MSHSSHVTRYSDSSLYDEVCTKCGATDARGCDNLDRPCPANPQAKKEPEFRGTHHSHVTRYSDSSLYDEVCVNCGQDDGRGNDKLSKPCPNPPKEGKTDEISKK